MRDGRAPHDAKLTTFDTASFTSISPWQDARKQWGLWRRVRGVLNRRAAIETRYIAAPLRSDPMGRAFSC